MQPNQILAELKLKDLARKSAIKANRQARRLKSDAAKIRAVESEAMTSLLKARNLGFTGNLGAWIRKVAYESGQEKAEEAARANREA